MKTTSYTTIAIGWHQMVSNSRHSIVQHFSLPFDESRLESWASSEKTKLAGPVTFGLLFCASDAVVHSRAILEIVRILLEYGAATDIKAKEG